MTLDETTIKAREYIEKAIIGLQELLREVQNNCMHYNASKTPRADRGNWDSGQDSYWYEFKCPSCGKFWTEPQ